MKKLSLDLDDLRVESFATDGAAVERGTVHAAQAYCCYCCCCCCCCTCAGSCGGTCWGQYSCPGFDTCIETCWGADTCDQSCQGTCVSCYWSCNYTECDCPSYYPVAAEDRIPAC